MNDAVIAWNGWAYTYDANGNMAARTNGGITYNLAYDQENRTKNVPPKITAGGQVTPLTGMTGGGRNTSFVYDWDGNRQCKH